MVEVDYRLHEGTYKSSIIKITTSSPKEHERLRVIMSMLFDNSYYGISITKSKTRLIRKITACGENLWFVVPITDADRTQVSGLADQIYEDLFVKD